jgi:hypothetical protein
MSSLEKDVFYFEGVSEENNHGVVVIDLSAITARYKALDRGTWFVQLEYLLIHHPADQRAFMSTVVSPEVLDSKEDKAILGLIRKIRTRTYFVFSTGDTQCRRLVHPMSKIRDQITFELRITHAIGNYVKGQIADNVPLTLGISIHIPHGQQRRSR